MRTFLRCRSLVVVLVIAAAATVSSAQYKHPNAPDPHDGINWELVKTGLYMFSGQGSNSLLRLTANGLILVDGKLPGNYKAIRARAERISDQPIRALILTNYDESHSGNNAKFLENGTAILAQENVKLDLASYNSSTEKAVPPTVTYGSSYPIHMGGVDVQLLHFGSAHTNADTVVYFPNLKVVAVGDLFASAPDPNYAAGGSLVGWGPVLARILKLDFDTAVPSSGPVISRAELEAFKARIDTLVSRAGVLVSKGVPQDQFMSQLKTDDLGWKLNFTPAQVEGFYGELSKSGQQVHAAGLNVPGRLAR
jgi:cyclase